MQVNLLIISSDEKHRNFLIGAVEPKGYDVVVVDNIADAVHTLTQAQLDSISFTRILPEPAEDEKLNLSRNGSIDAIDRFNSGNSPITILSSYSNDLDYARSIGLNSFIDPDEDFSSAIDRELASPTNGPERESV